MSRYFPHTDYEEDQPYDHTILAFHVLHRGFQAGAIAGGIASVPIHFWNRYRAYPTVPFRNILLKSTGVGAIGSIAFLAIGLQQRMKGQEEYGWKQRSWRLRENRGQMEVDDFSILGMTTGVAMSYGLKGADWRMKAGGAAVGNLVGVAAYMAYRYGLRHGEWRNGERGF